MATLAPVDPAHDPDAPKIPAPGQRPKAGEVCPQCFSDEPWGQGSWCPSCGHYPRIGVTPNGVGGGPGGAQEQEKTLAELFAPWARVLAAGVVVCLAITVYGTLTTTKRGWDRTQWTVLQFSVGFLMFLAGHIWSYFAAVMTTDRIKVVDFFLKPLTIWGMTFQRLPEARIRVWLAGWGLSLALLAPAAVGGVRYGVIFDEWGYRKEKNFNVLQTMMENAPTKSAGGEKAETLEDAVNQLAGTQSLDGAEEETAAEPPKPKLEIDCVIIGYAPEKGIDGSFEFGELAVATVVKGKLQYVGPVKEGIDTPIYAALQRRLPTIPRDAPFVPCTHLTAKWVKPVVICKIRFDEWSTSDRLVKPVFLEILDEAQPKTAN